MKTTKHLILAVALCLCSAFNAEAAYNGTPVTPKQINSSNYTTYGFTSTNYSAYNGWYAISTAEELYGFAALVNGGTTSANGVLTADIIVNENVLKADGTLNGTPTYSWTPIGTSSYAFNGIFDGNGHTVSGLYFYNLISGRYPNGGDYVGLIGCAGSATIKNVGVIDSYLHGTFDVGAILGYNSHTIGSIVNCFSTSTIVATRTSGGCCAGGIAGYNGSCTINNCFSIGKVIGNTGKVGGIVGEKGGGSVSNCFYLAGMAKDGSNVVQYGIGGTIGSTTADVSGQTTSATAEEFASVKIAYLLNGSVSGGTTWYKNLSGEIDA